MDIKHQFMEAILTGREIEFRYGARHYFESHSGGNWYIFCEETKRKQCFNSPQELISCAMLQGRPITELWDMISIDFVF